MNEEQKSQNNYEKNEYETYYEPYYEANYEANYEAGDANNNFNQTPNDSVYQTPEDGKNPNILCAISLACEILPTVISGIAISALYNVMDENASTLSDIVTNILGIFDFILMAAGLVLMIYVRIKYPKNVFGKVLMWLYIAVAVIMTLLAILYMVIAFVACISCISCIQDLG